MVRRIRALPDGDSPLVSAFIVHGRSRISERALFPGSSWMQIPDVPFYLSET